MEVALGEPKYGFLNIYSFFKISGTAQKVGIEFQDNF